MRQAAGVRGACGGSGKETAVSIRVYDASDDGDAKALRELRFMSAQGSSEDRRVETSVCTDAESGGICQGAGRGGKRQCREWQTEPEGGRDRARGGRGRGAGRDEPGPGIREWKSRARNGRDSAGKWQRKQKKTLWQDAF